MRLFSTEDEVTGPINLGNPSEFTMLELADMIVRPGWLIEIPHRASAGRHRRSAAAPAGYHPRRRTARLASACRRPRRPAGDDRLFRCRFAASGGGRLRSGGHGYGRGHGRAGYIGTGYTCKMLSQAGLTPVVYDNLSTGHADSVKWGPLVKGDVRDTRSAALRHPPVAADLPDPLRGIRPVGESVRAGQVLQPCLMSPAPSR